MSFENNFLQIKKCDLNDNALDCVDNKTLRVERKLLPIHLKLHPGAVLSIMAFTGRGGGLRPRRGDLLHALGYRYYKREEILQVEVYERHERVGKSFN